MDGWIFILAKKNDTPGAHQLFWIVLYKPGISFQFQQRIPYPIMAVSSFDCRGDPDAFDMLYVRLEKAIQTLFLHAGTQHSDRTHYHHDRRIFSMNIALIAMSGIRACDKDLLDMGLTLPGFVERSKSIASLPSLGLLTLAGMTPSHHTVHYIEIDDIRNAEIKLDGFDLAAISSFSAQINEGYQLAAQLNRQGVKVVMGGLHVTSNPNEPALYGASAVTGEGECAWPTILRDAEAGELKDRYDVLGQEFDLAEAPMPAFELLDMNRYNRITIQTSRGCPWKCSFCASSILLTDQYKQKPMEKVLAEIDKVISLWPRPFIEFADDNSFINKKYWKKLLPQISQRKIRWFTETDLSIYKDPELLDAMRMAGCMQVLIGLESPTEEGLDHIEKNANWKYHQQAVYKEAINIIQEHGIRVNTCFTVGLDGHTKQIFQDVLDWADEVKPFDIQVTLPTPFPGTPFYSDLEKQGRLNHPGNWDRCTLFDVNFEPLNMTRHELRAGFHRLVKELYSEEATRTRKEAFRQKLRLSRKRQEKNRHSTAA
jgi:radical SAM superfamily enzyme YgiQ (UPF0313 family)